LALFLREALTLKAFLAIHFVLVQASARGLANGLAAGAFETVGVVGLFLEKHSFGGIDNLVANFAVCTTTTEAGLAAALRATLLGSPLDLALFLSKT
jgi:hypothetical protein